MLTCASGPVLTELSTNLLRALEAVQITGGAPAGGIIVTLLASPHRRQERRGDPGICTGRFSRRDWPVDRDGREGPPGGGSVLFSFVTAAGGRSEEGEASRARERGES
jgi:hypothetical protein